MDDSIRVRNCMEMIRYFNWLNVQYLWRSSGLCLVTFGRFSCPGVARVLNKCNNCKSSGDKDSIVYSKKW